MRGSLRTRAMLLGTVFLLISVSASADLAASSCVSCHSALDERNAEPVRLWKKDLHNEAGLKCHDCHGGDPDSLTLAMAPSSGFVGVPGAEDSVRLCGGCHSDNSRIPDLTTRTDQMDQYRSGPHGSLVQGDIPTCVTCHQSHGIYRVTDPSSPVFPARVVQLCLQCHGSETSRDPSDPWNYREDVHGRAILGATNPRAPTCINCHGAHRAAVPEESGIQMICGNCHTKEYEFFQAGPHGRSSQLTGEPSCTSCHGYHGISAAGIDEIIGKITDNCQGCHMPGSRAWSVGSKIDGKLGVAISFLASLQTMSENFRLAGIDTSEMDRRNQEAFGWLLQVESAIHSVDSDWEELTGMAKVKMMTAWDLGRDFSLERGIRRIVFLFVALLAATIFALLAFKLKLTERDRTRRQLLGSPEARQREQEHYRK